MEIVDIVGKGVTRLVGLIGIWAGAKTDEEKAMIKAKAVELVAGLDPYFAAADARDKAKMDALQAKINEGTP